MALEAEYRKYAAYSLELANRQPASNADKSLLLVMAEAWLDLADRIARRREWHSPDHPLIEQVLGPDQPKAG